MNTERDFFPPEELQLDLRAMDKAIRDDMPMAFLYEMANEEVDPEVMFTMDDFEVNEDRYYHGLLTACSPSLPVGTVDENAEKFVRRFRLAKSMMIKSFEGIGDIDSESELGLIEELNIVGASDFTSFCHATLEAKLVGLSEVDEDYYFLSKSRGYWELMDRIIVRAFEMNQDSNAHFDTDNVI